MLTTKILYQAEAEDLTLLVQDPSPELLAGEVEVFIVIDDTLEEHPWIECRTDNNQASGYPMCTPEG